MLGAESEGASRMVVTWFIFCPSLIVLSEPLEGKQDHNLKFVLGLLSFLKIYNFVY